MNKLGNEIYGSNERFNIESKKESINTVDVIFEKNTNFEEILVEQISQSNIQY